MWSINQRRNYVLPLTSSNCPSSVIKGKKKKREREKEKKNLVLQVFKVAIQKISMYSERKHIKHTHIWKSHDTVSLQYLDLVKHAIFQKNRRIQLFWHEFLSFLGWVQICVKIIGRKHENEVHMYLLIQKCEIQIN